jgi:hypothetical protein
MTQVVLSGPGLPDGALLGFCGACAMTWKLAAISLIARQVTAAENSSQPGITRFELGVPPPGALARAVAWAVFPPTGTLMALCWTHMLALDLRAPGSIIPATAMPDGGAVHLDRPH